MLEEETQENKEPVTTKTEAEVELEQQTDKYGRKTVMTPSVIVKLEQAFALGCSDLEACYYAGISKSTLYNYQNSTPEFLERKEELKAKPILLARQSVMKGINGYELRDDNGKVIKVINAPDPKLALDFLKNKMSKEFKTAVDNTHEVIHDKERTRKFWEQWGATPEQLPVEATPEVKEETNQEEQ